MHMQIWQLIYDLMKYTYYSIVGEPVDLWRIELHSWMRRELFMWSVFFEVISAVAHGS